MQLKKQILDELEPLFKEDNEKKLFLKIYSHNRVFSPKELREYHKNDKFIFGKINWVLVDTKTEIEELENKIFKKENEISLIKKKIRKEFECN